MEQQTNTDTWLDKEIATFNTTDKQFEQLPSLKLVKDTITEFDVDFSVPFNKWNDETNNTLKAIIPVTSAGVKMNFWLNVKNPLYAEIVKAGKTGQTHFKVLQTGSLKATKYTILK